MISTTNPEKMTSDERRNEVATILASGLLRRIRLAKEVPPGTGPKYSNDPQIGLDVPAKTPLSVSHRPTG